MLAALFSSLRSRLIVLVLLAIIPAIFLFGYTVVEQQRIAAEDVQADAQWLTRLMVAEQERVIDNTRQLLLTLSHLSSVRQRTWEDCNPLLTELLVQYPSYANLGVASPEGVVLCSALQTGRSVDLSDHRFFQRTVETGSFSAGNYRFDETLGVPIVNFGYPVLEDDRLQFVVFTALDLNWLNQTMNKPQLPEGSALIMADAEGTILLHFPDPGEWVGRQITDSPITQRLVDNAEGVELLEGVDQVSRLYAFTPLNDTAISGYSLGVGISEEIAFATANQLLIRQIIGLSAVFIFAVLAAWIGGEVFFLRRLRSLLDATERLAAGDLSARTGLPYGGGELSQLARSFDQMGEVLERREIERERIETEIVRQNRDLSILNTITGAVSSSLELPEILESLKNLLAERLNIPGGVIFFYDEFDDSLYVEAAWGVPAAVLSEIKRIPTGSYHYERVVREKMAVHEPDLQPVVQNVYQELEVVRPSWQSYLCIPLLAKDQVQGVLDLFSKSAGGFSEDQITLLSTLGRQVGVAIQNARLFEQIWAGRRRLQMLSQELLEVQESERRHISRELHDEIGQALTAVKVNLQAARRALPSEEILAQLDESIDVVERTLEQVRDLSLDLRPSLLDDLGVVAALRWYIDRQAQRAGFEAQFTADLPELRLPSELETTCFRVVQEALTNIIRHANASHVKVELRERDQTLELFIRDDGIGFDVDAVMERAAGDLSLGLLGMQERVQLVSGQFEIVSDPAKGTEIRAVFPLAQQLERFEFDL